MTIDLALRQRIEARIDQPRQPFAPRSPFDASVRQAEIFVGKYWITAVMDDGSIDKGPAVGNRDALMDGAYDRGAMGVTAVVMA